jgi:hypothetical protein
MELGYQSMIWQWSSVTHDAVLDLWSTSHMRSTSQQLQVPPMSPLLKMSKLIRQQGLIPSSGSLNDDIPSMQP